MLLNDGIVAASLLLPAEGDELKDCEDCCSTNSKIELTASENVGVTVVWLAENDVRSRRA